MDNWHSGREGWVCLPLGWPLPLLVLLCTPSPSCSDPLRVGCGLGGPSCISHAMHRANVLSLWGPGLQDAEAFFYKQKVLNKPDNRLTIFSWVVFGSQVGVDRLP